MILEAVNKYEIDLDFTVMVGDSAKDIECGRAAGCSHTVLVATGNGPKALDALAKKDLAPDFFADDLLAAAQWIVSRWAHP